jgi:putative metalloenzyme radical SAM/SPASM domain maturase
MRPAIDPTSGTGLPSHPVDQSASAPLAVLDPVPAHRRAHPSKLFVEVTTRCNLHCAMCVKYAPGQGLVDGDMSEETFERLSPAFPHLESLVLNGIGEPLLHRGLEGFIARAKASMPAGAWVGFQTNGQLIGPRRAEALVAAGVDRIAISADAVSPERLRSIHGGARLAPIEAAAGQLHDSATALGRRLSLGLEFVAMRDNLDQLPLLVRWAARHRFEFIIVSHLLAYDPSMAGHAAFSPASDRALAVYRAWRSRAEADGIDLRRYLESRHRFAPPEEDERAIRLVREMVADAKAGGISLRIEDLLQFDEARLAATEAAFAEAASLAAELGIELRLPSTVPTQVRRCEFVEEGSAFVSWAGDVHPCYFLWHRFDCYLGGVAKTVRPQSFGNVDDAGILEIWNGQPWRTFRGDVTRYDFPFCYDCNLAMCDYVQDGDFEQDCHLVQVPCAACLWCTGPFQCLR